MRTMFITVITVLLMVGVSVTGAYAWTGDITIGGNLQTGNTDSAGISLDIDTELDMDSDRLSGKLMFNYAEEDKIETTKNIYGSLQVDHFITESLYAYVSVELAKDKFKNLNLRSIVGPGVGLQMWNTDKSSFAIEGGLAYFSEDLDIGTDTQWVTARMAANYSQQITESIIFKNSVGITPSLEDFQEYKLRNEAELKTALSERWNLKLTNIYQHDSQPSAGVAPDDVSWIAGLAYDF